EPDDPRQAAVGVVDGRRDRVQVELAFAGCLGVSLARHTGEVRLQTAAVGDRPARVLLQCAGGKLRVYEGEEHLPRRRRVADARPADTRDALYRRIALHEVDRNGVVLAGRRERRRHPGGPDELLQVRPRDVAEVETAEHEAPELQQARTEAVAAG